MPPLPAAETGLAAPRCGGLAGGGRSGSRVGALAAADNRLLLLVALWVALGTPRRAGGGSEAVEELERMAPRANRNAQLHTVHAIDIGVFAL